jgi:hypothetical protein
MATSIFLQSDAAARGRSELARVFGAEAVTRTVPVQSDRRGVLEVVRGGLRFVLKQCARALYVSPVLVVAKLALRSWSREASDFVIVVFCGIVVAFFATLNLYIFWSIAWFTQTKRKRKNEWKPLEPRMLPAPDSVKVSGRVERLGREGDGVVLRDFWASGLVPWRLTEIAVFLVRPDDPKEEPAVVACTTAPDVEGGSGRSSAPLVLGQVSAEARALAGSVKGADDDGALVTLSVGDRVEVTAVLAEPVENLDRIPLPGGEILVGDLEGAPYRDQPENSPKSGRLLLDDEKSPLRIVRVG